ncbi:MAG: aldose 1-epimerase [Caulobacter sp.]|nr:aldose 1-epimerase [Caulobacter sp.]
MTSAGVEIRPWGRLETGQVVRMAILRNTRGFEARVGDYGATIVGIRAPDRDGRLGEVVLGFADFADYVSTAYRAARPCFGATIGRYANRIKGARFTLDGQEHALTPNEGDNQLHGGPRGFDQRLWTMETLPGQNGVRFSLISPDGDQGFPGTLRVSVEMAVADDQDSLILRYRATTDRPTHVNLTAHPYFNLDREADTIRDHRLQVFADRFTPADGQSIPTGEIADLADRPLDLRTPAALGDVVDHPDLSQSRGLNHNYVLTKARPGALERAARLLEPRTGRCLEVWTTEPGLQVYSAGFLPTLAGRREERFEREAGVCLETQHFPDSPNQDRFPSTRLNPGEVFTSETQLRFTVETRT